MSTETISRRRSQAGFTIMEVLVALVVFVLSVVGLVAMESRSIESQRAAAEIRSAERVAQEELAELTARGFLGLLSHDFAGNAKPSLPYDDTPVAASLRTRDFIRNFAPGIGGKALGVGANFLVFRTVDMVANPMAVPTVSNPPVIPVGNALFLAGASDLTQLWGLRIEVLVLWIDRSNPQFPPPASLKPTDLTPAMIDPTNVAFAPWVGYVRLRTVRLNDMVMPKVGP